jgi:hypothetical protein
MRVNIQIDWKLAPPSGRFSVRNGSLVNGLICVGRGEYDLKKHEFEFSSVTEPCRICFAVDVAKDAEPACVLDKTFRPFEFDLASVLSAPWGTVALDDMGVTIDAEKDYWAEL